MSARRPGILDATSAATIPASGINDTWPNRMKLSGICGTIDLPGLCTNQRPGSTAIRESVLTAAEGMRSTGPGARRVNRPG